MESSTNAEENFPDSPPCKNGVLHSFTISTEEQNGSTAYAAKNPGPESKSSEEDAKKKYCCRVKMLYVLSVVVFLVWVLLALPIIFYHLPTQDQEVGYLPYRTTWCNL